MTSAWGNSWSNAWGNAWGLIAPIIIPQTRGGIDEYKQYRKYLEDLTEATKLKTITKPVKKIAKQINKLPIKTPEIKKAASQKRVEIDYEKINNEISLIYAYINQKIQEFEDQQRLLQEQEDELIILMAL